MEFTSENKYTVYFNDGTFFSSDGKSVGNEKSSIKTELNFIAFHIEKEIAMKNKNISDVIKVELNLNYSDEQSKDF